MAKVALYARVSDDKKKSDGDRRQDVERQLELLRDHALREGHTPDDIVVYIDDAKSAFTDDWNQRKDFIRLFNDCRRHFIVKIFIEDMTRFSRNISLGLQWLKELGDLKVHLVSLKEGELEVTSSKGWMQSLMLLMFAEWDSRIKSEKVKSGMERVAAAICPSCNVRHLGRHPASCRCEKCGRV